MEHIYMQSHALAIDILQISVCKSILETPTGDERTEGVGQSSFFFKYTIFCMFVLDPQSTSNAFNVQHFTCPQCVTCT